MYDTDCGEEFLPLVGEFKYYTWRRGTGELEKVAVEDREVQAALRDTNRGADRGRLTGPL